MADSQPFARNSRSLALNLQLALVQWFLGMYLRYCSMGTGHAKFNYIGCEFLCDLAYSIRSVLVRGSRECLRKLLIAGTGVSRSLAFHY